MEELKKLTIPELRRRAQANAPEAGRDPIIGHSIRFFSIYFTKAFLRLGTSPLMVTVWSVLLFLAGCALFIFDWPVMNFIGVFVIYISIVLDGCNGEIARLKKYRPDIGSIYIEPISHDIQYGLMFLPLAVGAYHRTGSLWVIYAAFVATLAKLIQRFCIARYTQLVLSEKKRVDTEGEAVIPFDPNVNIFHKTYRWFNRNIFSSVGIPIPLLAAALLNRVDLFLALFAVTFSAFAVLHFWKEIRHIARIDLPQDETFAQKKLTVVILAGGRGTRLGNLTTETPKALIEVAQKPIIAYAIAWAKELGATKIIVSGNHLMDQLANAVREIDPAIQFVPDIVHRPGSRFVGVLSAAQSIEGDVVIFDGDYIFHQDVARKLRSHAYQRLAVHACDSRSSLTTQDVLVSYDDQKHLLALTKTAGTQPLGIQQWYFNSLLYCPAALVSAFLAEGKKMLAASSDQPVHVEDAVLAYMRSGSAVDVVNIGEPMYVEIDTPEEYRNAETFVSQYGDLIPVASRLT